MSISKTAIPRVAEYCRVCRKATAVAIVKDFAYETFAACKECIRIMTLCHPSSPVVVTDLKRIKTAPVI